MDINEKILKELEMINTNINTLISMLSSTDKVDSIRCDKPVSGTGIAAEIGRRLAESRKIKNKPL